MFKKPGEKKKEKKLFNRTPRLRHLEKPNDKRCRWCWNETGTECFRHYEGSRNKYRWGKGIGQKLNDNKTVWACDECDKIMSKKQGFESDLSESRKEIKWLEGIIDTHL